MHDIIQLLPDSIANQIAAGEVVQRPASVVKELLENAIDAQAQNIQLIVKDAGKTLIQVIDDGVGMSETDARMCFERHATSKIRTSEDLFHIRTMGFRGEAMASIAAVAQVELRTRRHANELGTMIRIEASELKAQESVACTQGSNILVKNLFFNVPARRNFLKSGPVEMRHVIDEFQRVALAQPEIGFTLYHNEQEVYSLPPAKLSKRIVDLFGKNYREQLGTCQEDTPYVTVSGFVGKPTAAKKTRGEQFFFANKRFIRHNYLHHAVLSAFEGLIPENTYPFYVLFIDIDPVHIDINVHPTKTEIKFDDERSVYAIVQSAVRKAMNAYNIKPSIDFDANVNVNFGFSEFARKENNGGGGSLSAKPETSVRQQSNLSNWSKLYEGLNHDFDNETTQKDTSNWRFSWGSQAAPALPDFEQLSEQEDPNNEPEQAVITFKSKANRPLDEDGNPYIPGDMERTCYQIHNKYLITQTANGILLIDQRAAYERILFDKYIQILDKRNGASQQLLFPKTVSLNPADFQLVIEMQEEIRALGFVFTEIGQKDILVQGVPVDVQDENEQSLFEDIIEQFKHFSSEIKVNRIESLARSFARRSSYRHCQRLSIPEMAVLIDQLLSSANPQFTPNGEATFRSLSLDELFMLLQ
jgi:DNA mismatch repair protein MutL